MLRIALLVKDWGISINEKEEVFGLPRLVLPPVLNVSFRLYSPFSLFFLLSPIGFSHFSQGARTSGDRHTMTIYFCHSKGQ